MRGHGQAVQYSVFRCFLTPTRKMKLMSRLLKIVNVHEDQVILFELGSADSAMTRPIEVIGQALEKPDVGPKVF